MPNQVYDLIVKERERQRSLPGSEYDITNGPNDWVAIITKYLSEEAQCKGITPEAERYKTSLIKAGAVIIAALEHIEYMEKEDRLK